jgi:hypothetical protein
MQLAMLKSMQPGSRRAAEQEPLASEGQVPQLKLVTWPATRPFESGAWIMPDRDRCRSHNLQRIAPLQRIEHSALAA